MSRERRHCACLLLTLAACLWMDFIGGGSGGATTVAAVAAYTFEEYVVEHEVSASQAKNAAVSIDLNAIHTPFGCQKCTTEEIRYCESANFVSDHCCCDRRFHEELPYIPHTCYFGRKLCRPIAGHCDDYTKLRKCCCDKHALALWKAKSSADSILRRRQRAANLLLIPIVLHAILRCAA